MPRVYLCFILCCQQYTIHSPIGFVSHNLGKRRINVTDMSIYWDTEREPSNCIHTVTWYLVRFHPDYWSGNNEIYIFIDTYISIYWMGCREMCCSKSLCVFCILWSIFQLATPIPGLIEYYRGLKWQSWTIFAQGWGCNRHEGS